MYQVLARKWRPQGFEELVGQRHITRTLSNAIESGRLAHAYLFAGLRGTGKTTVARILAKCLNCEEGPTTRPCNSCLACREITESRAIDVLEIDAASRTKVEQTRELLEMVSYAPARDRNKILIIDEAHMLSKASFNALLKTLEEPPPNVVFILATTEIQKLLPTILSRCQVFDFRRVPAREVAVHLRKLCNSESIEISDASLDRVARAGEGSVRDSLSVLERVLAFCGEKIDDDEVLRALGAVRTEVLVETVQGLAARDAGAMLGVLDGLVDEGHDLIHFWSELIAALRDLLFQDAVPDRADLLTRSAEEASALTDAASGLSRPDLLRAFQVLAELEPALKASSHPKFMFEAALIRLAALADLRPIEEILAGLDSGSGSKPGPDPGPKSKSRPIKRSSAPARAGRAPDRAPRPTPDSVETEPERARRPQPDSTERSPEGSKPQRSGSGLLQRVRARKPMIGAMLEQAADVSLEGGVLTVTFDSENDALAKSLEREESLSTLESSAEEEFGKKVHVAIRVGGPQGGAGRETTNARSEPSATSRNPRPSRPETPSSSDLLEQAKSEPGVRKLLREFGAHVLEVSPLEAPPVEDTGLEETR